ncbi:MAG: hypothetical protein GY788_17580, partial [bacterium]|nr:hypothetical protein [bacterium]
MGKYEPLRLKLEGAQESTVALRFSDIDTAVGGLPNSAHEYRAWWSNSSSNHVAAQSWLAAGFHVSSLDVNGQQVTFTRGPTPNRGTSQHHRGQRAESDVGLLEPVALAAVEIESLQEFLAFRGESAALKDRISAVEAAVAGHDSRRAVEDARQLGLEPTVLAGARLAKRLSAQVDVVVHAAGIVLALPEVLEPGEIIEYVSLGAGNTGKDFDLETDQQIAEFKFIDWAGGTEPVRQDTLLI